MNNIDYIINLLLKDNNIAVKVKNLNVNFISLDNSVNKVNKTVNTVSTDITNNITQINTDIKSISSIVAQTTNNINKQLNAINFSAVLDIVRNVADAFKNIAGAEVGMGYEQSMADFSSITGIVGNELEDLGRVARETGKDSGLGASGAANAFALLASQIQVDKIGMEGLKVLQKETITLAQAAGMEMSDAATAMAATINQFGLEASEANRVINVLAAGSKYGAAEITDLAQSFKVTGAVAAAAGLSVEQSAGAIEVLSKSNLKGAEAGTALRNIIVKMQTTLGMDLGETGLSTALEALKPRLDDVTWLAKTFGTENLAAAQFLITNAAAVDEMTTAVTGTNVAQEQAAIRTDTTAEKMKRMQATMDDFKISLFDMTGGTTAYISTLGSGAVMIAQMIPLFSGLKTVIMAVANAERLRAIATAISNTVSISTMSGGLMLGVVLSMMETRVLALTKAFTLQNIATKAAALGQAALNVVMNMNPVALIVTAISALVIGLIAAYNYCDGFRMVVDRAWEGVKNLATVIWESLVKAFTWLGDVIGGVWDKLKELFGLQNTTAEAAEKTGEATKELADAQKEETGVIATQNGELEKNIETLNSLEEQIQALKTAQKDVPVEEAVELQKQITLLEQKLSVMKKVIAGEKEYKQVNLSTLGGVEQKISELRAAQKLATGEQAIALEKEIRLLEKKKKAMESAIIIGLAQKPDLALIPDPKTYLTAPVIKTQKKEEGLFDEKQKITIDGLKPATVAMEKLKSTSDQVGESLDNQQLSWNDWGKNLAKMQSPVETLRSGISSLATNMINSLGQGADSMAEFGEQVANTMRDTIGGLISLGVSYLVMNAMTTAASLGPFGFLAAAGLAALAGGLAKTAFNSLIPAFANGGLVYGDTLARVGEYPGAANNPEVIAPLSKLKNMLAPQGFGGGTVEFVIKGNRLVGILNKESNKGKFF